MLSWDEILIVQHQGEEPEKTYVGADARALIFKLEPKAQVEDQQNPTTVILKDAEKEGVYYVEDHEAFGYLETLCRKASNENVTYTIDRKPSLLGGPPPLKALTLRRSEDNLLTKIVGETIRIRLGEKHKDKNKVTLVPSAAEARLEVWVPSAFGGEKFVRTKLRLETTAGALAYLENDAGKAPKSVQTSEEGKVLEVALEGDHQGYHYVTWSGAPEALIVATFVEQGFAGDPDGVPEIPWNFYFWSWSSFMRDCPVAFERPGDDRPEKQLGLKPLAKFDELCNGLGDPSRADAWENDCLNGHKLPDGPLEVLKIGVIGADGQEISFNVDKSKLPDGSEKTEHTFAGSNDSALTFIRAEGVDKLVFASGETQLEVELGPGSHARLFAPKPSMTETIMVEELSITAGSSGPRVFTFFGEDLVNAPALTVTSTDKSKLVLTSHLQPLPLYAQATLGSQSALTLTVGDGEPTTLKKQQVAVLFHAEQRKPITVSGTIVSSTTRFTFTSRTGSIAQDKADRTWEGHCNMIAPGSILFKEPAPIGDLTRDELKLIIGEMIGCHTGEARHLWTCGGSGAQRNNPLQQVMPDAVNSRSKKPPTALNLSPAQGSRMPHDFGFYGVTFLRALQEQIGKNGKMLLSDLRSFDRTKASEVWNQAVYYYRAVYSEYDYQHHYRYFGITKKPNVESVVVGLDDETESKPEVKGGKWSEQEISAYTERLGGAAGEDAVRDVHVEVHIFANGDFFINDADEMEKETVRLAGKVTKTEHDVVFEPYDRGWHRQMDFRFLFGKNGKIDDASLDNRWLSCTAFDGHGSEAQRRACFTPRYLADVQRPQDAVLRRSGNPEVSWARVQKLGLELRARFK